MNFHLKTSCQAVVYGVFLLVEMVYNSLFENLSTLFLTAETVQTTPVTTVAFTTETTEPTAAQSTSAIPHTTGTHHYVWVSFSCRNICRGYVIVGVCLSTCLLVCLRTA